MRSHTEKLVLLALADFANASGECWPSMATLAERCSLTRRSVVVQMAKLESQGFVEAERSGRGNRYRITEKVNAVHRCQCKGFTGERDPMVNHVHQKGCTSFTGEQDSLVNDIHQYGEPRSHQKCTSFTSEVNHVHTNHQEPSEEPSLKPSEEEASEDAIDIAAASPTKSEELSASGQYLEALSLRIALKPEEIHTIVAKLSPPAGSFDAWLRNRAAEDWLTPRKRGIGMTNWFADFERFATSWAAKTPEAKPKRGLPPWLPANWKEIAAKLDGEKALGYTSPDQIRPTNRHDFERACKGDLDLFADAGTDPTTYVLMPQP